jgi:hypothetical protein
MVKRGFYNFFALMRLFIFPCNALLGFAPAARAPSGCDSAGLHVRYRAEKFPVQLPEQGKAGDQGIRYPSLRTRAIVSRTCCS